MVGSLLKDSKHSTAYLKRGVTVAADRCADFLPLKPITPLSHLSAHTFSSPLLPHPWKRGIPVKTTYLFDLLQNFIPRIATSQQNFLFFPKSYSGYFFLLGNSWVKRHITQTLIQPMVPIPPPKKTTRGHRLNCQ